MHVSVFLNWLNNLFWLKSPLFIYASSRSAAYVSYIHASQAFLSHSFQITDLYSAERKSAFHVWVQNLWNINKTKKICAVLSQMPIKNLICQEFFLPIKLRKWSQANKICFPWVWFAHRFALRKLLSFNILLIESFRWISEEMSSSWV